MNSKKASGKASLAATGSGSSKMGSQIDEISGNVANLSVGSGDDGEWEVFGKKTKNRSTNIAARPRGTGPAKAAGYQEMQQQTNVKSNNWNAKPSVNNWQSRGVDPRRPAGRGNSSIKPVQSSGRGWESAYMAPPPVIAPPLQNGWQWGVKAGTSNSTNTGPSDDAEEDSEADTNDNHQKDDSSDDALDDDDDLLDEDYDSDVSQKSHETRKKIKWFKAFFEALESLTVEQLNDPIRQWHCPACQDGPGAIDWYKGLQPLMTHAKTKGSTRVKLHRELAELLEEELRLRGTSVIPAGETFGKWKGLRNTTTDREIVWPPMVVIRNTILEKDDNDKWIGMGNEELLDYFDSYTAVKARHSYGPQGHRGNSLLIFEASAIGYLEAERLHKHFAEQGTDRDAWEHRRVLFHPGGGGKRQLYGYLATKEDLDIFNQHSHGKSKMKFEMRSYQEMVVIPMRQMGEENQKLIWLKNKVAKQQRHSKALEETVGVMSSQLRLADKNTNLAKMTVKKQHEECKEEMDYMERFVEENFPKLDLEEKKSTLETSLQNEHGRAELANCFLGGSEEHKPRQDEVERFSQMKGVKEFEAEREKLLKNHEEKLSELKRRFQEEVIELKKEFDHAMTQLMEKYAP